MDQHQDLSEKTVLSSSENKNLLSGEVSLQLALLKFISCLAVIYIHSYIPQYECFKVLLDKLPISRYILLVGSQGVARTAVPVFFAVSGYIYFSKQYDLGIWQFFKRKAKGILLPYFIWNTLTIGYIFAAQQITFTRKFFPESKLIENFGSAEWVNACIGWENGWYPFLYPLWFLPYLFAVFMIVHLFRKYFYRSDWLVWGLLAVNLVVISSVYLVEKAEVCGPLLRLLYALTFFTSGKLLLKYRDWLNSKTAMLLSSGIFILAVVLWLGNYSAQVRFFPLALYCGIVFVFALAWQIVRFSVRLHNAILFLSGFSFLIYVTHEFALTAIWQIVYPRLPVNDLALLAAYIVLPLLLAGVLITCGFGLKKLLPKVYDFLFRTS